MDSETFTPRRAAPAAPALLLLALSVVAGGPASGETVDVQVSSFSFTPAQVTIQVGDTVRWTNTGGVHNVSADDGSFRCANGCDGQGGNGNPSGAAWVVTRTFTQADVVDYHCEPHQAIGMTGRIVVEGDDTPEQEAGAISFVQSPVPVTEGAGQVQVVLRRSGGDDGMVSVDFATSAGSATAGVDFEPASGTVTWADNDDANKSIGLTILDDDLVEGNETFDVVLSSPGGGATLGTPQQARVRIVDDDVEVTECVADETTLCLNRQGRFQVRVTFDAGDGATPGRVIDFGQRDSGLFYFFEATNAEILVKVLDACIPVLGNRYWVFFAATTDVKFDLVVTDTDAGVSKTYSNPAGMKAESVTDTAAFSTCP